MTANKKEELGSILLNNEPNDISTNDLFGTLPKGKAIKDFLEAYHNRLGNNKMFALYGEWGSGKSSILHFLDQKLSKEKFKTLFFETWQNEKDENLPLSLAFMMAEKAVEKNNNSDGIIKEFKKSAAIFLNCFLKGISVKFGNELVGIDINGKDMIEAIEKKMEEDSQKMSFTQRLNHFKSAFENLENEILGGDTDKRLIVFVDDLDRCETENILTLISTIKLFFTYGKRTIFICGVDKKAVMNALQTKYDDVVKAEEYLEKVFDINWSMPQSYYPVGLMKESFPKADNNELNVITQLFVHLNFQNPRHIKKVLNKYELLRLSKEAKSDQSLIPYIIMRDGAGDLTCTLFVLFAITLYEFRNEEFHDLADYEMKYVSYTRGIESRMMQLGHSASEIGNHKNQVNMNFYIKDWSALTISTLAKHCCTLEQGNYNNAKHLCVFLPNDGLNELTSLASNLLSQFPKHHLGVGFCRFMLQHRDRFLKSDSQYGYWMLFAMCKTLL